jgi:Zn-dependent protease
MHHSHDHHTTPSSSWNVAISATLHCLTGCAIGEVLGMVIATALGLWDVPSIILAVILAFFFGYGLTVYSLVRAVDVRRAVRLAFASDTVSIATMEVVDNLFIVAVPGALAAELTDSLFWGSLAVSLAVAFVVTVPINRWLIARGKGHAVVHQYH